MTREKTDKTDASQRPLATRLIPHSATKPEITVDITSHNCKLISLHNPTATFHSANGISDLNNTKTTAVKPPSSASQLLRDDGIVMPHESEIVSIIGPWLNANSEHYPVNQKLMLPAISRGTAGSVDI